jgi:pyrroloquinoline quinone biosynthesis protein B
LWGTARVLGLLAENPIFGALNPAFVERRSFALDHSVELVGCDGPLGLAMTAFAVPGKVPLFLEGRDPAHLGGVAEDTIGLEIAAGGKRFHFIPGCARMTPELAERLQGSELVFFDGTLWSDDELVRLGISEKTGKRMGHMSINGGAGTLSAFDALGVRRKIFIHVNTTNPVLDEESAERAEAVAHGWEVAEDGMRISL